MQSSALRRLLLAGIFAALIPVPVVRAADVQPIVTLDPIATSVYRGDHEYFMAHISDGAPFRVAFEWSPDGTTWHAYAGLSEAGSAGDWEYGGPVPGTLPVGTSFIRAFYPGSPGFLPAASTPRSREVSIHQAQITDFEIFNPNQPAILPGTAPVRVTVSATHVAKLERLVNSTWELVTQGGGTWWRDLPALGEGDHTFRARVDETEYVLGTTEELTVHVSKGASEPNWDYELAVQANRPLFGRVSVNGNGGVPFDAPMTVQNVATGAVIASGNVGVEFTLPPMSAGSHAFLVTYGGNSDYEPSSKTFNVVVTSDVVEATSVGRNYATFYPVKDSYRDTLTLKGIRVEPLSVSIRIHSPTGRLVKSTTLARAAGTYGYAWNGRTSAGSLLAAGKYKIVQVLVDAAGTSKTFTSDVTISHKKIVLKTAYITKLGSSVSAKGDPSTGSIAISTSGGYARLTGKSPNGWVGVGYQFTLPSAPVYKSIAFQVYAKGPRGVPPALIGLQNFATCAYTSPGGWYESCFDRWRAIGNWTAAWFSASGSATINRHGRTVRGLVSVQAFTYTIYKARIKVVYGVLQ
jgi:hypothetical protein